jgi:hypothetical protein
MKKQLRTKLTISRESLRRLDRLAAGALVAPTATTCGSIECPSETGGCTGPICDSLVTRC